MKDKFPIIKRGKNNLKNNLERKSKKEKTTSFLKLYKRHKENFNKLRSLREAVKDEIKEDPNKTLSIKWDNEEGCINFFYSLNSLNEKLKETTKIEKKCIKFLWSNKDIPPEGIKLSNVYTLLKVIGEGGSGRVYLARDNNLDILCAIKILNAHTQDVVESFLFEVKNTAKLRHPNIVSIYYADNIGNYFYYVMEYIEGKTCEELIKEGTLKEYDIIKIGLQLANTLKYAHDKNIIHRDIKPSNIMIEKNTNNMKLLDLGLSFCCSYKSNSDVMKKIVGTPYYISPEQAEGNIKNIDKRTDIYGYGATLYHLLTGKVPFQGETVYQTLSMVLNKYLKPKEPRKINQNISKELSNLVMKCLEKDKDKRFQSMEEIIEILEKLKDKYK